MHHLLRPNLSFLPCTTHHHHAYIRLLSSSKSNPSTFHPPPPQTLTPQTLHYTHLFSHLKSPSHLSKARQLQVHLLLNGFFHPDCTDRVLGSQLVNAYVRLGSLKDALLVFHCLPQKSNVAWNGILRGLVEICQFSEAIEFYHLMLREGVIPDNYTYPLILKACSGLSSIEEGRRVFELLKYNETHRSMKRNMYVECALIDMFAKCGSLKEARHVFNEMHEKDLASWSSMICGALQNGEWVESLRLFWEMRLEGLRPDSMIVAGILSARGRLESKHMGMTLQGLAIRSGFVSDLYISNALIDMYCKCGDAGEAHFVFSTMVCRDVVSWSTMIAGYAQNYQYHDSFHLFLDMKSSGAVITPVNVASVVPALTKLKLLKQGKEMHNYVIKQGFVSDVVVGSVLIDMYASCGSRRAAENIFEIMTDKGITIWNSMIAGYALNGDIDEALWIFRRIWESKLKPNSITFMSILPLCTMMGIAMQGKEIHGYAVRTRMDSVVSVKNCLIDMYCKCGYLEYGVKVFDQMREKNVVTYNTIISGLGIHGRTDQAFSCFDQMTMKEKIIPNKVTFGALLSTCSHAGLVESGWYFYNSMEKTYRVSPNMEHYSCMVDLLGRAGRVDDAFYFIKRMPVDPGIDVWGSLLNSFRVHNKVELVELLGELILQKGIKYSGYFVLLSNVYAFTERWEDALMVRTAIKEKGLMKKPGCSWIQVSSRIHQFYAIDVMHSEIHMIRAILKNLLFEMKSKDCVLDSC